MNKPTHTNVPPIIKRLREIKKDEKITFYRGNLYRDRQHADLEDWKFLNKIQREARRLARSGQVKIVKKRLRPIENNGVKVRQMKYIAIGL